MKKFDHTTSPPEDIENLGLPDSPSSSNATPSLSIDWELYGTYLEASDLSDEQKREVIEALWSIVISFVDLGFGIHPVQQACEPKDKSGIFLSDDLLSSLQKQISTEFDKTSCTDNC